MTSPAICESSLMRANISAVKAQKIFRSAAVVFRNRLVPFANSSTTSIGVFFDKAFNSSITAFTPRSKTSVVFPLPGMVLALLFRSSCSTTRLLATFSGITFASACASSSGTERSRCRNTASVLRSSSRTIRVTSPGRGPMVPKTGIMLNCVAQWVIMCSASSTFPRPLGPSSTTMPPSAKGLPAGACAFALPPAGMVAVPVCSALSKPLPSISFTLAMPSHLVTLQSSTTFTFESATMSGTLIIAPSMGWSYHGKRIVASLVSPGGSIQSLA
mmetsp:Transcript_60516/g.171968  ORF Transcript_60516/g.171968 Transcript_60516/m.171968 type:complete len:273 (+) Transcript_60516:899-1717(+)